MQFTDFWLNAKQKHWLTHNLQAPRGVRAEYKITYGNCKSGRNIIILIVKWFDFSKTQDAVSLIHVRGNLRKQNNIRRQIVTAANANRQINA